MNYKNEFERSRIEYLLSRNEIIKVMDGLHVYEGIVNLNSRKVGMYKFIKKLLPSFDILYQVSSLNSIASVLTLNRMIIDHYAVFYLLTSFSTEQERNLRYYLYLIDGIKTRSNVLRDFISKVSTNTYDKAYQNINSVLQIDSKSISDLQTYINTNNVDSYITERIIQQNNWKFVDRSSYKKVRDNSYSWIQLYKLARIPEKYSNAFQKHYSSYVHGLGITLMNNSEEDHLPLVCSALSLTAIILSLIIKILLEEYSDKLNNVNLNPNFTTYMNHNWENWH